MDTVKASHPSTGPELGDAMAPEETVSERSKRQHEEERETDTDTSDGSAAVPSASHRMAQEKHRYHTIGHQQLVTYGNNPKKSTGIDFSTVRGTSSSGKSRAALKQVFFSQNVAQEDRTVVAQWQVDSLKKVLDSFTADLTWKWGDGGTEDKLDQSWTDIVASHVSMSKTQRHQQEALWELIYTEIAYINKLTIAKEVVLAALSQCHEHRLLQEVTPNMLFSNLPSILDAHRLFWQQVMYPMLQEVRLTGRPFDPLKLEAGCLQFPDRFDAYYEYCWEEDRNVAFTRSQIDTNPQFHTYISWVESHPQCGRMRLGDMQATPHQRITKYPLLLNAILKNTEDLPTKNALQRMLKSVSNFVASINDYLQFKADELALSTAAQRIEGYSIEGLSEEIDKHIREFCCFDLTSPIRGVEPKSIRKQLLEETLKVRGRKDYKELVVLLFTDVVLLTKTQKKSEKLKVVRPPLPLERIRCIELRDGYSFVLVEVGDLGCEVSLYSLSTPSPDSCSSWVSALREAKTSLETLRKNEANKTLRTTDDTELNESPAQNKLNGQSESDCGFSPTIGQQNGQNQSAHEEVVEKKESTPTESQELKTEVKNNSKRWEKSEPSLKNFTERRVTWNHSPWDSSNSKDITKQDLLVRDQSNVPSTLLQGKHTEENGTLGQYIPRTYFSSELLMNKTQDQEIRRDLLCSQLGEEDKYPTEAGKFVRKLDSPRLRRQRPNSSQPSVPFDNSRIGGEEPLGTITADDNQRRASNASIKPQDTHRVLKLGSLKKNNGMFWHDAEKISSPDPQTVSESEKIPDVDLQTKPKLKPQRSISVAEISFSQASSLPTHRLNPSPPPGPDSQSQFSPLQDLLQRAKQREKERGLGKAKTQSLSLLNSSAVSASPSSSASEGDRETEGEESVGRSTSSAQRSTLEETIEINSLPEDMRMDWPGWCFDDEEVFDFQNFDEDFFNDTSHKLRRQGPKPSKRHDDGECSEV